LQAQLCLPQPSPLHEPLSGSRCGWSYKRIAVVGHSLGSILAYDLLSYFWAEREAARTVREGTSEFAALCKLEEVAERLEMNSPDSETLDAYFTAQRELRRQLAGRRLPESRDERDLRWLISDLVTFGSPLTHAEFLIAADRADLESRKAARELCQSPPYREFLDANVLEHAKATLSMPIADPASQTRLMSYPVVDTADIWKMHHAAPFAVVRWTNVFDPAT